MFILLVFFLFLSFYLFTLSSSLIFMLISLISSIIINSLILYINLYSWWISYLMLLSIVSGLLVVLSFVIMICPKDDHSLWTSNWLSILPFLSILFILLVKNWDVSSFLSFSELDQLTVYNSFCSIPYMFMLLMMLLFLLSMLLVVDSIIFSSGGSLVNMKD